jgi:WD40 repeat protein
LWADGNYYAFNYVGKTKLYEGLKAEGDPLFAVPYNASPDDRKIIAYSGSNNVMIYMATHRPPDNRLVLYDITNDKSIADWKISDSAYSYSYSYGIISPSGRYAAILLDQNDTSDQVMVYDLESKELIINEILKGNFTNTVPSLAFSADEQIVTMLSPEFDVGKNSWNLGFYLLRLDGSSKPTYYEMPVPPAGFPMPPPPVRDFLQPPAVGFAISPDSKLMAVGTSNGAIYMLDTSNGNLIHEIPGHQAHTGPILSLAFNEDGSLLASLERSGIVKIWGMAP